jgi:hypothetical protein
MDLCDFLGGTKTHSGPDEAGEFSGDGHDDLGPGLSSLEEASKATVKPVHGLVGEGDHCR